MEVLDGSFQDGASNTLHGASEVLDGVFSHGVAEDLSEESSGLRKIAVGMVGLVSGNKTSNSVGRVLGFRVEGETV